MPRFHNTAPLLWGPMILNPAMLKSIWLPLVLSWRMSAIRSANTLLSSLACRVIQLVSLTIVNCIWLLLDPIWSPQFHLRLHQPHSLRLRRESRSSRIHLLSLNWTHRGHILFIEVFSARLELICSPVLIVLPRRMLKTPLRTLTLSLMTPSSTRWTSLPTVQLLPSLL